ncbi:glucosyl transferase GtrII family protein, partial [Klebsiella pneumoniae]
MQNLSNSLAEGNKKNVYIFYFFLIMLTFSPVIFFSYAFSDDWSTFFDAITRNGSSFQWDVQSGRPVYAVFRYYGQMLINDISSFSYLRLFNILSLVVLSGFIYNFIDSRKIFDNPVFKVIFPLLICLLPAFQVYASWATCFPFTISVLLAGISYNKCFPHSKQRSSLPEKLASIVVLWVAFAIYQPTAITFLFFFMLDSCIKKESSLTVKKVATCFIILVIGVAGSFIMSKVLPVWLYGESLSRAELTADIGGKMKWFINESLINSVNNYNIQPVKIYSWFSSLAILIGLYTIFVGKSGRWKTFIVIAIGIGSYAPNLATKENWAAFRSLVALELIISTLFLIGINSLVSRIFKQAFVWPLIALTIMIIAQ